MTLYDIFTKLDIDYDEIEHEPVFTADDAARLVDGRIDGLGCKSLFLTDKKGCYYLVLAPDNKRADLKMLSKTLNCGHLSFASDRKLKEILDLTPGSVTPFGVMNDKSHEVVILIDADAVDKRLLFHPLVNTRTVAISYDDLIRFLDYCGNEYKVTCVD